jgi:hypothetical protein
MLWDRRGLIVHTRVRTNFKFCDYGGDEPPGNGYLSAAERQPVNEFLLAVSCTRLLYYTRHKIEARGNVAYTTLLAPIFPQ